MNYFDKQVKKINKQGHARIYEFLTFRLFKDVLTEFAEFPTLNQYDKPILSFVNFTGIRFTDSIEGDHSVIDFYVKECPDWKFRIQWYHRQESIDRSDNYRIKGEVFCCYKPILDKFNYYNSNIKCEVLGHGMSKEFNNTDYWYLSGSYDLKQMIEFIVKEPYLAFCRDYKGWDYNRAFHSRESAKKAFESWKAYYELSNKVKAECDKEYLDYVKENILPIYGKNTIIVDRGDNWSPRYEMICKSSEFTPEPKIKPGCYSIMTEQKEAAIRLNDFADFLSELAENQGITWYPSSVIASSVMIIADKEWNEYLKWTEKEKNAALSWQ